MVFTFKATIFSANMLCLNQSSCLFQLSWWSAGLTSLSWRRTPRSCCRTWCASAHASASTSSPSSWTSTRPSNSWSSLPTSPWDSSWTTRASSRTALCPNSRRSRPRKSQPSKGLCQWRSWSQWRDKTI